MAKRRYGWVYGTLNLYRESNFRAQKFYNKYRFREVGEHIFKVGNHEDRDLLYQLDLE
jgi:ribosomal protein S18 acetylase RimI-like enzyme